MEIHLNGKLTDTGSSTLLELIEETGLETESLVAEVNLAVVRQDAWPKTPIQSGDRIELLCFVGGG